MKDISFIFFYNNHHCNLLFNIEYLLRTYFYKDRYEVIVINFNRTDDEIEKKIGQLEDKYSQEIILVNCNELDREEDFLVIALEYANGKCFLPFTDDRDLAREGINFDSILFDNNLCDDDECKYIKDKYNYIENCYRCDSKFIFREEYEHKCLVDYRSEAGSVDLHYFFQDIYVASKVMQMDIRHIFDIGSRLDGYIAHLLSMGIRVTMIDIRPLNYIIDHLDFIKGNAVQLDSFDSESIENMSCLHALEHFGLGRYGDEVDADGWRKALKHYKRIIKKEGYLFLSVPVGQSERVCFNAHRVFNPMTILKEMIPEMALEEFTCFHNDQRTTWSFSDGMDKKYFEEIICEMIKTENLGNYDCGIFIFKKRI